MKDQLSAMMDDELDVDSTAVVVQALKADAELGRCWSTYHLIGDTLRGAPALRPDFQQRLMQRIDQEPTILAPRKKSPLKSSWAISAAASVAAVMFVGWLALQQHRAAPEVAPVSLAQNNISAESLNSYLLAHQEFSPEGSTPTAYYVRPAVYTENGR